MRGARRSLARNVVGLSSAVVLLSVSAVGVSFPVDYSVTNQVVAATDVGLKQAGQTAYDAHHLYYQLGNFKYGWGKIFLDNNLYFPGDARKLPRGVCTSTGSPRK